MEDYNLRQICLSLRKVGLEKNDVVFCHSNLGFFGNLKNITNKSDLCEKFFNEIFKIIGRKGTLIVPTFSYSYFNNKAFDSNKTPGLRMGIFSEWIRLNKKSKRSNDPNFSVSAIGNLSKEFIKLEGNVNKNTYSENSFFFFFYYHNGKILNFNFPGTTIIHYYEKLLNTPYRFDKKFHGKTNGKDETWTVFSRRISGKKNYHNPHKLMGLLRRKKDKNFSILGKGEIFLMPSKQLFSFIKKEYKINKSLLIY